MEIITAAMLKEFSDLHKREIESLLPELVKRLVIASNTEVRNHRFPAGDDVWAPGYDGIAYSEKETTYVNSGYSVWEFGTNNSSLDKIESDYKKRTEEPLGVDKKQTVFYLVMSKIWAYNTSITQWENNHNDWKLVKVYDAVILADWINSEPTVCTWLLAQINKNDLYSFFSIEKAWDKFSKRTFPLMVPELFLSSREEKIADFMNRLEDDTHHIIVKSYTRVDALGFVLSLLKDKDKYSENVIVIENEITLKKLMEISNNQVFVLMFNYEGELINDKNRIILCTNNEAVSLKDAIQLDMLPKHSYEQALRRMGLSDGDIYDIYCFTHGNLRALIRKIPGNYIENKPDWADKDSIDALVPLVFMRTINVDKDKDIVEKLSEKSFEVILNIYNKLSRIEDAPLKKVCNRFVIVNYEEAWDVLGLASNQLYYNNLINLIKSFSNIIRTNQTQYIWSFKDFDRILRNLFLNLVYYSYEISYDIKLEQFVHELLDMINDPYIGMGIKENLGILAEATPNSVMDFFNNDIKDKNGVVYSTFLESSSLVQDNYCRILDALDELMLNKSTVNDAAMILLELCSIKRDYFYSNCPKESLINGLLAWRNEGSTTLNQKEAIVNKILKKNLDIGFPLVVEIISRDSYTCASRAGKKRNSTDMITIPKKQEYNNRIAEELFSIAFELKNPDYLMLIIKEYSSYSAELLEKAAAEYNADDYSETSVNELNFYLRNRFYSIKQYKSEYDYPYLSAIEAWINKTTLKDKLKSSLWAFRETYTCPANSLISKDENYILDDEPVRQFRKNLLQELIELYGQKSIIAIIESISDEGRWGHFLSDLFGNDEFDLITDNLLLNKKINVLTSYLDESDVNLVHRFLSQNEERKQIIPNLYNKKLLIFLSDEDKKLFWQKKIMRIFSEDEYQSLLKYNPKGLVTFLYLNANKNPDEYIDMTLDVFEELCNHSCNLNRNDIDEIYSIISQIDSVHYSFKWANLCFRLIRKYDVQKFEDYPMSVNRLLFENPKLIETTITEDSQWRFWFEHNFRLPEQAYENYDNFRKFLNEIKRIEDTDAGRYHLRGNILGNAHEDVDGFFPHEFVRVYLEEQDDTELDTDVALAFKELFKVRVVSDGHDKVEIMKEYNDYADFISIEYPHTAKVLKIIGNIYRDEGDHDFIISETWM